MTDTRTAALPVEVVVAGSTSSARAAGEPVEVVVAGSTSSARAAALPVEVVVMRDPLVYAVAAALPVEVVIDIPASAEGPRLLALLGAGT